MKFIGLGTGKCGSSSLAYLLNKSGVKCVHERNIIMKSSWNYDSGSYGFLLKRFKKNKDYGEIALFYLKYVPFLAYDLPDLKFICLKREEEDFINSFIANLEPNHDPFSPTRENIDYEWDLCYPKYGNAPVFVNVRNFYRSYYEQSEYYEKIYPKRFKTFNSEILYTIKGQNEVYDYLEVPKDKRYLKKGVRENKSYRPV